MEMKHGERTAFFGPIVKGPAVCRWYTSWFVKSLALQDWKVTGQNSWVKGLSTCAWNLSTNTIYCFLWSRAPQELEPRGNTVQIPIWKLHVFLLTVSHSVTAWVLVASPLPMLQEWLCLLLAGWWARISEGQAFKHRRVDAGSCVWFVQHRKLPNILLILVEPCLDWSFWGCLSTSLVINAGCWWASTIFLSWEPRTGVQLAYFDLTNSKDSDSDSASFCGHLMRPRAAM